MYVLTVTHSPSSRFGDDTPEAFAEPLLFGGFRTRTGRRARTLYGDLPEITFASHRRKPATWKNKQSALDNLDRLTRRGYFAQVTELPTK